MQKKQSLSHSAALKGAVLGWGPTEGSTVDTLASHALSIHAADWAVNVATHTSFYVPQLHQPTHATLSNTPRSETRSAGTPHPQTSSAAAPSKHTVVFLMTDGDNIQWLLNTFSAPFAVG